MADYKPASPLIQSATATYEAFVTRLQQSKICMFDSSIIRKSIAKFYESFLAGCVVASDLPFEMEELYRDVIIVLPQDASEEHVAEVINAALQDEAELQRKAARALNIGLQHFTCHGKAERVLDAVQEFRDGFRGYIFPFGFRSGCQGYHFLHQRGLALNPWCPGPRPERSEHPGSAASS